MSQLRRLPICRTDSELTLVHLLRSYRPAGCTFPVQAPSCAAITICGSRSRSSSQPTQRPRLLQPTVNRACCPLVSSAANVSNDRLCRAGGSGFFFARRRITALSGSFAAMFVAQRPFISPNRMKIDSTSQIRSRPFFQQSKSSPNQALQRTGLRLSLSFGSLGDSAPR